MGRLERSEAQDLASPDQIQAIAHQLAVSGVCWSGMDPTPDEARRVAEDIAAKTAVADRFAATCAAFLATPMGQFKAAIDELGKYPAYDAEASALLAIFRSRDGHFLSRTQIGRALGILEAVKAPVAATVRGALIALLIDTDNTREAA